MYSIINQSSSNKSNKSNKNIEWPNNNCTVNPSFLLFMQSIKEVIPIATLIIPNRISVVSSVRVVVDSMVFDYDCCDRFARCISTQLTFMERNGITLIGFDLSDVLSIENGKYFVVANFNRIIPFANSTIQFISPFVVPTFASDEMKMIHQLPASVSYVSARIGLGLLLWFLVGSLDHIKYTKLYWFIKRCLSGGVMALI